jgi:hypothetical protein
MTTPKSGYLSAKPDNASLENLDSYNGGLVVSENIEAINYTKDDANRILSLPNFDLTYNDVEIMRVKPRIPN